MARIDSRSLERQLIEECQAYQEYLSLLEQERIAITKVNAEKVVELTNKRTELTARMVTLGNNRLNFVESLGLDQKTSLTQAVSQLCPAQDKRRLMTLINKLKSLVKSVEKQAKELSQLVHFSLSMIDGSLSIIWSATQNVTKSYDASGLMKQKYSPKHSRHDGVLKQA